jgi:16S rRNA (cytosine1402-N4)-methyltransferase
MLAEVLTLLQVAPGDVVVDCTAGRGGHAARLAAAAGPAGTLVLADLDAENLAHAAARATAVGGARVIPIHARFDAVPGELRRLGLAADAVLADLGFCSNQVDDPGRGLSFAADGPLDMRLDRSGGPTAAELLARLSEPELARILFEWGEEPLARRIARNLVAARDRAPITTTAALAELVTDAYGPRASFSRLHPATRTFMALRIAVNGELDAVEGLLTAIAAEADRIAAVEDDPDVGPPADEEPGWLRPGARIAVISFHSLEDRAVKRAFRELADRGVAERLTRKPWLASHAEVRANPRSRSARLRGSLVRRVMDRRSAGARADREPPGF